MELSIKHYSQTLLTAVKFNSKPTQKHNSVLKCYVKLEFIGKIWSLLLNTTHKQFLHLHKSILKFRVKLEFICKT